jgi:Holliday junction resolvase RusA-like endonuclease
MIRAGRAATKMHRIIATPLDGSPVLVGDLVLSEPPPSLNNAFVNGKTGRFKSAAYKAWRTLALIELRQQPSWHVRGAVNVRLVFNRAKTRADLDNLIKASLDILVASGRTCDDRNVRSVTASFGSAGGVDIQVCEAKAVRP